MLTVPEALDLIRQTVIPASGNSSPPHYGSGQVLLEDIVSNMDSPPFDKSMMDGYAICAADLQNSGSLTVIETITAGNVPQQQIQVGQASQIMTGAPVPRGAAAVIPVEQVKRISDNEIDISQAEVRAGQHILKQGESMRSGETVISAGTRLQFPHIALLAELGIPQVLLAPQPTVAILATGDELVPYAETPRSGQIRNTNEPMLQSQVASTGATPVPFGIARDDKAALKSSIQAALKDNFLLLTGGVSAGVLDLVPSVLQECGVEQVFHKVQVKPGKPIWFGVQRHQERNCYVFGLPGNPVSSMVCFELFVRPAMNLFQQAEISHSISARLGEDHLVKGGRPIYHPARIEVVDGEYVATPTRWIGSADLRGAADANGMIHFAPQEKPYQKGEPVTSTLWF